VSDDTVRRIADAVLYEGYILWPYRRGALKNQRRWTFGGVFPPAHAAEHPDDAALMRTECLVEGLAGATVDVRVRFLHVVARGVARARADGSLEPVDELVAGGERHVAWEEAVEREAGTGPLELGGPPCRAAIAVEAGTEVEPLDGGALVRSWEGLAGALEVGAQRIGPALWRVRADVLNTSPFDAAAGREAALARTLCSTHTVLEAAGGAAFVSLTDPPDALRAEAEACENRGTWPVLVGEPGARDTLLSSPIILEDHPRVAPESPGDLFDGAEIDQLLRLSILSLTDEEKAEMRAADPRARAILERTEALTPEELMRLHGTVRDLQVRP
jgi:hypothetical protein